MKFFKFAVLALIFPLAMLFADTDYRAEAATIKEKFAQAIKLYVDGNNSEARKITQEAYFGHFENLEAPHKFGTEKILRYGEAIRRYP